MGHAVLSMPAGMSAVIKALTFFNFVLYKQGTARKCICRKKINNKKKIMVK